ncbi:MULTISPECIES: hypothetical protein [Mameliella]|uniref:hypothetical protein n=1 Tax=Mameliella TaxID=1434019 RepID=UPI000B52F4E4|nr:MULTISPECIES: hypothetical protein [Mameliella]OWV63126.1 hypothetical protein CDZ98_02860 [Mameliella alba]
MKLKVVAATALVGLAAACTQPEPVPVYVPVEFDKYGNVVGGSIVDGNYVLDDGTVVGPVSPDVSGGNRNRNRERTEQQYQQQQVQQTQTQQQKMGG